MSWDGPERRKYLRAVFPCKVTIKLPSEALYAHTENIGAGGIKVLLGKAVSLFTPVDLELFLLGDGGSMECQGKVVWIKQRDKQLNGIPSNFDAGIQFTEISDKDRDCIKQLVDKCLQQNH